MKSDCKLFLTKRSIKVSSFALTNVLNVLHLIHKSLSDWEDLKSFMSLSGTNRVISSLAANEERSDYCKVGLKSRKGVNEFIFGSLKHLNN